MEDRFKIYVEQLRDGHTEIIDEVFSPEFLDVKEENLHYKDNVFVKGEAYLADNDLILNLSIKTKAQLPCIICNETVTVSVDIEHFYHAEPIENIKGSIFNYKSILRENVILETPKFAECSGNCPQRKDMAKYFTNETEGPGPKEGYHPFSDL
jgi:DUF177 domain-containing protein